MRWEHAQYQIFTAHTYTWYTYVHIYIYVRRARDVPLVYRKHFVGS